MMLVFLMLPMVHQDNHDHHCHGNCHHHNHGKRKQYPKWTLERFLESARLIHGIKYNYDKVRKDHFNGKESKVPLKCNKCGHEWSPSIHGHINKKNGCPSCAGKLPWTLVRFIERARFIHGDTCNYDQITPDHVRGKDSKVPLKCNICGYAWSPNIHNHINAKSGCPRCKQRLKWDLTRFVETSRRIHGDIHDYSEITEDHFKNEHSYVPIRCKLCDHRWEPNIVNYIHNQSKCPKCAGHLPWTYDRFMKEAREIHGDEEFDYSEIKPDQVTGYYSRIPIKCRKCGKRWCPKLCYHIHSKCGCPHCCKSRGERLLVQILKDMKEIIGEFDDEVQHPDAPQYYYDFAFIYKGKHYIIEFDGIQHFVEIDLFTKKQSFEYRRLLDKIKTLIALSSGSTLIRIDYTQLDNLRFYIDEALKGTGSLYLSTPEMYTWITDPDESIITYEELISCAPEVCKKIFPDV